MPEGVDIDISGGESEGNKSDQVASHWESMADALTTIADALESSASQRTAETRLTDDTQTRDKRSFSRFLERLREAPVATASQVAPVSGIGGAVGGAALGGLGALLGPLGSALGTVLGTVLGDKLSAALQPFFAGPQTLFGELGQSLTVLSNGLLQRGLFGGEKGLIAGISSRQMGFPSLADTDADPGGVTFMRSMLQGAVGVSERAITRILDPLHSILGSFTSGPSPARTSVERDAAGMGLEGHTEREIEILSEGGFPFFRRQRNRGNRQTEENLFVDPGGFWRRLREGFGQEEEERSSPPPTTQPISMGPTFDFADRTRIWFDQESTYNRQPPAPQFWPSVNDYLT